MRKFVLASLLAIVSVGAQAATELNADLKESAKSVGIKGSAEYSKQVMDATKGYIEHTEKKIKHMPVGEVKPIHKHELKILEAAKAEQKPLAFR